MWVKVGDASTGTSTVHAYQLDNREVTPRDAFLYPTANTPVHWKTQIP